MEKVKTTLDEKMEGAKLRLLANSAPIQFFEDMKRNIDHLNDNNETEDEELDDDDEEEIDEDLSEMDYTEENNSDDGSGSLENNGKFKFDSDEVAFDKAFSIFLER